MALQWTLLDLLRTLSVMAEDMRYKLPNSLCLGQRTHHEVYNSHINILYTDI